MGVLFILQFRAERGGGLQKSELDLRKGDIGDLEVHVALEFEFRESALTKKGELNGLPDDNVHADCRHDIDSDKVNVAYDD